MKLIRLEARHFAGIAHADVQLGPGLNVLYGPNDLGKSTVADVIRAALLLPYGSSHADQYVPWTGGQRPEVELTFETESQRIWRVKKQFSRSGGFAVLEESRDGVDFWEVDKGRKVDGRIRELLGWGIPEPGGSGAQRGMPESFLATILLSTQADVAAVLRQSLEEDSSGSGRERIAAALQAVTQDPLFVSLLRRVQARRDEAYTEKGAKKTSRESPFRKAADLVRELREEKERCQRAVDESDSVEQDLRRLSSSRTQSEEQLGAAAARLASMERLARETSDLRAADEQVTQAAQKVTRIETLDRDIAAAERSVGQLAERRTAAEDALKTSQGELAAASTSLDAAHRALEQVSGQAATADVVQRQALEIQIASSDRVVADAGHRLQAAGAAQKAVDEARDAEAGCGRAREELAQSEAAVGKAGAEEERARQESQRIEMLDAARALQAAEAQADAADANLRRQHTLRERADAVSRETEFLEARRSAIRLPSPDQVASMRRLETDIAAAHGALNVGLAVTVTPARAIEARIRRDAEQAETISIADAYDVEAGTELQIEIADVAAVRVRGGTRQAQQKARTLEDRWKSEAVPLLTAAGVSTLVDLEARIADARNVEATLATKQAERAGLEAQLAALDEADEAHRQASDRVQTTRAALGATPIPPLLEEIAALGANPAAGLRTRRERATSAVDAARERLMQVRTAHGVVAERLRGSQAALEAAVAARQAAAEGFPGGIDEARASAQAAIDAAAAARRETQEQLKQLDNRLAAERIAAERAVTAARGAADASRKAAESAQRALTAAIAAHAEQVGGLGELQRARAAEDLGAATLALDAATQARAALPVPARQVSADEIAAARGGHERAQASLAAIDRDIQRAHGALEQVGGGVARDRLQDVSDAYESAARQEQEVEADCEAWRMLLDQMKLADDEQASNLGQVLGPAVADRFAALTAKRYEGVQLTAALGTDGVVMGGEVRPTERLSVGTREQLSTLYRLALAEYLQSTVVLDDQLVQSDEMRMDWFRALLAEKARVFQIVVLTCRPEDYLKVSGAVAKGKGGRKEKGEGVVRAIDLAQVIRR